MILLDKISIILLIPILPLTFAFAMYVVYSELRQYALFYVTQHAMLNETKIIL